MLIVVALSHHSAVSLGLVTPDRSPSPPSVVTDSNRIGAEEDIDDFKGKTEEEIKELVGKRESKANAQILEMVGDIPDADAKPPENVLFVCKLNPVTTAEDLEIIFSRFGPIQSCEVIKDQKTGDSLQYAFIEFENEDDCVKAFFKMDNVLIDDRRIHVDFSQSLAKVKGIRRRKSSEDQLSGKKGDGFVAKQNTNVDSYEMVFEEEEIDKPKLSDKMKRRYDGGGSGGDSERRHSRQRERERDRPRERREREREREREGRDRERKRHYSDNEDGHYRGQRHRERERKEEGRREKQRGHRSRSRSRERHHKHSHYRSHSHERDHRH